MLKLRTNTAVISLCLLFFINSCEGQSKKSCVQRFKEIRKFAYAHPDDNKMLDSALHLINGFDHCDNVRIAVADIKIRLLLTMQRYQDAINYADSLTEDDFQFKYKKSFTAKGMRALYYRANGDTVKQKSLLKEMVNEIDYYVKRNKVSKQEFNDIYTDRQEIELQYLTTDEFNKEVDRLKAQYPDKADFFEFFRKHPSEETTTEMEPGK